jgi:hypothetical protein
VCELGQLSPTGQLRQRINKALAPKPAIITSNIGNPLQRQAFIDRYTKELNACIQAFRASRFPSGAYPSLALSRRSFESTIVQLEGTQRIVPEVFKTMLRIYFYLEPLQIEPLSFDDHLAMLGNIIIILGSFKLGGLSSEPRMFESLHCHLRAKFLFDSEKCYGNDSWVGMFEEQYLMSYVEARKRRWLRGVSIGNMLF